MLSVFERSPCSQGKRAWEKRIEGKTIERGSHYYVICEHRAMLAATVEVERSSKAIVFRASLKCAGSAQVGPPRRALQLRWQLPKLSFGAHPRKEDRLIPREG